MLNIRDIGFEIVSAYRLLWANRKLSGYAVISCLLIALICYAAHPRTYRVSLKIPIKELSSLNQDTISANVNREEPISLITSKDLLTSTATALNLDVKFYKEGFFRDAEISKVNSPLEVSLLKRSATDERFSLSIIDDSKFLLTGEITPSEHDFGDLVLYGNLEFVVRKEMDFLKPGQSMLIKTSPLSSVVNNLSKSVKLMPLQPYDTEYTLFTDDKDPEYGERILRQLISLFWQSDISVKQTNEAISLVDKQLDSLNNRLIAIQKQIDNGKKVVSVAPEVDENQASKYRKQMAILQVLASYVNVAENQFSIVPNTFNLTDKSLPPLIERLNTLRIRKQQILAERNPNKTLLNKIRADEMEAEDVILDEIVSENKKIENLLSNDEVLKTPTEISDSDRLSDEDKKDIKQEKQACVKLYLANLEKRKHFKALLRRFDLSGKPQTITVAKIYSDVLYYIIIALLAGVLIALFLLRYADRNNTLARYLQKLKPA